MPRDICIDRLQARVEACGHQNAYCEKVDGQWKKTTWAEYGIQIKCCAAGLISLGHKEREPVAILGYNRAEWLISCLAAQMANAISSGIYTTSSPEEILYIIDHSEATFLVVENSERWREQVLPIMEQLPRLKKVILMLDDGSVNDDRVISFGQLLKLGEKAGVIPVNKRIKNIDENSVGTLIYTSGTTGLPKAVMLSHKSIAWTVKIAVNILGIGQGDCLLSYLPLAHVAEQMFSVYTPISSGITVNFAESMDALPENLKEIQPTIFFGVPRVYEKFYDKVKTKMEAASGVKAILLGWARNTAINVWQKRHKSKMEGVGLRLQYALAKKIIFNKLKPQLGFSRARICVTGAAPISQDIVRFFMSLDIPIFEVYGQSEDCGPTSFNLPGATKLGSVGKPIPGLTLKIAEDGEIILKAPSVFMGYYKDEAATKDVLQDGWLLSGDVGHIDKEGYLKITDRKKDLLITAGGKNIAPQNLETMLKQIPLVSLAVVVGDKKKYLAALLTPNLDHIYDFAKKKKIDINDVNALVTNNAILAEIQKDINVMNKRLAKVEQIKKFTLLPTEFAIETGELTATMKIKRKVINTRYQNKIDGLYC